VSDDGSRGGAPTRGALARGAGLAALFAATLVAAGAAAAVVPSAAHAQDSALPVGSDAPRSVTVESLDGKPVDLGRYIGRQPVVIEFWATWCALCKELEPAMRAAHAKYGGRVAFLAVAVSVNQSPERVKLYAQRHQLPGEILFDRRGAASGAFGVLATSTVIVLDRAGKVVYSGQGGEQDIEGAVRKAL
jgi:thiol-disulfide isomerase/thioredoxin